MDVIESYLRNTYEIGPNQLRRETKSIFDRTTGKYIEKEVLVIKGPLVPKKNVCPAVEESCKLETANAVKKYAIAGDLKRTDIVNVPQGGRYANKNLDQKYTARETWK